MPKYNIKEIKKRRNKDYPADINEDAESAAVFLKDTKLLSALKYLKDKPWYGEHYHYDKNGKVDAIFEIDKGIVRKTKLVKMFDNQNVFFMTMLNKKIYTEKKDNLNNDEKAVK